MADDRHYDVIFGTGAGGGTLAHRLTLSQKQVLLLERGDYPPRERDNRSSTAVFVQGTGRRPFPGRHGSGCRCWSPLSRNTAAGRPRRCRPQPTRGRRAVP